MKTFIKVFITGVLATLLSILWIAAYKSYKEGDMYTAAYFLSSSTWNFLGVYMLWSEV